MDGRLSPERVADITAACEADRLAKARLRHRPEPLRLLRIDHVFVGPGVRVRRPEVARATLARRASDHPPLLVELEIGLTLSLERPGKIGGGPTAFGCVMSSRRCRPQGPT